MAELTHNADEARPNVKAYHLNFLSGSKKAEAKAEEGCVVAAEDSGVLGDGVRAPLIEGEDLSLGVGVRGPVCGHSRLSPFNATLRHAPGC